MCGLFKAMGAVMEVPEDKIAAGRGAVSPSRRLDTVSARQLFSAVGQVKLINHYYELFLSRGIVCGQVLTIKESLSTRGHYLNQKNCIVAGRSSFGRGGMLTKCHIARKVAAEGIEVVVASGRRDSILTNLILGATDVPCTRFIPAAKPATAVKKWIARSEGFAKGTLHVNAGTVEVLEGPEARSLLPVGVEKVEGTFEKDDIVLIVAPDGRRIGVGCISTDNATARRQAGRRGFRPLIYYDYLCLD